MGVAGIGVCTAGAAERAAIAASISLTSVSVSGVRSNELDFIALSTSSRVASDTSAGKSCLSSFCDGEIWNASGGFLPDSR